MRHCFKIALAAILLGSCTTQPEPGEPNIALSLVGTNDVHGVLQSDDMRGGLTSLSGYFNALRSARGADNVLLLDAGDMWQGTLESNLNEGAAVVQAFNAMGYAAAAIGNHEFDFGPIGPAATARDAHDDPRGALKQRAVEATFKLLAANLVDVESGNPVGWTNVSSSTLVKRQGVDIGIVGVVTSNALQTTIAANVDGLQVSPLAAAIRREALALRASGATVIIVVAHAGGQCEEFEIPLDLTSCDSDSEIFEVARALPAGLVDHIFAGHRHRGVAHVVNGISITSAYSHTQAFSRVDLMIDRSSGRVNGRKVFPPQAACPFRDNDSKACAWRNAENVSPATYEGYVVQADSAVVAIADRAADYARAQKLKKIGVYLETPFTLKGNPESALGNLMTDAMLASLNGDVAIHNVSGGIRGILPAGELTYGDLYEMFPFDNRAVVLSMRGRDLRKIIAAQAQRSRRRAGISGIYVSVNCSAGLMDIRIEKHNGDLIEDDDNVRVIATDFLALGGDDILTPAMPADGFQYANSLPLARDLLETWFEAQKRLNAEDFLSGEPPRWRVSAEMPAACQLPQETGG